MLARKTALFAATIAAPLLWAPLALAAPTGEQTPLDLEPAEPARAAQAAGSGGLLRTFVGLAVVVALIYGVYWILRQVKASREEKSSGSGLSSLATLPLGPNRSLHMVRAGTDVVLIGVAEHGVTPIRTYAADEARAAGLLDHIADDDAPDLGADLGGEGLNGGGMNGAGTTTATPTGPAVGQAIDTIRRWTVRR